MKLYWAALVLCAGALVAAAQFRPDRTSPGSSTAPNSSNKLIRERGPASRRGVPIWTVDEQFRSDIFSFVRLRFNGRRGWQNDYPGADLNLSYR